MYTDINIYVKGSYPALIIIITGRSGYAPLDEMVPSSYCFTKITSTKSRGAMMPIAAEGVTVLQMEMSCVRVRDKKKE